jgi:Tfp pilus assembly protein PilV
LVEVLVAILILGVALVGLTQGVTLSLTSSKESELQTTAAMIAAGQIETLRVDGGFVEGTKEGDLGEGFALYHLKQTLSKTAVDGLFDVEVVVENAKTSKPIYALKTLLFERPEDTTPKDSDKKRNSRTRGAGQ